MMLRIFLINSFVLTILSYLIVQYLILHHNTDTINKFKQQAEIVLKTEKTFFTSGFKETHSDLLFLAEQAQVQLNSNSQKKNKRSVLSKTTSTFLKFSEYKKYYDQIRYIDANGVETIRVNFNNGKPVSIPTSKLQNKKHRYYFTETLTLKIGEVYISPFDLNIENKEVEVPLKPMIRFATPIQDQNNQNNGIIIVNYFGQFILDKFLEIRKDFSGTIMLLNSDGYYLIGRNRDQEWSFMFTDKKYGHFASDFPKIWLQIKNNKENYHQSAKGLFVHSYLKPELKFGTSMPDYQQAKLCKNCTFIMVAYLNKKQLEQIKKDYLNSILPLVIFITLVLIYALWLILEYYNKHKQSEQKFIDIHNSLLEERDLFVGGPTIVFKWLNHFGWPVEYVSDNVKNVLGYQAEQFIQQELNLSSIIVPEYRQQVIDNLNKAKKQGKDWLELDAFQVVTCNGEYRWTQAIVSFIKDNNGQIKCFYGYFNDISQLKKIESQLIQSKEYLQTVLNTIADPTIVINVKDYSIKVANKAANKVYLDEQKFNVATMTCYQLSHKTEQPCSGKNDPCPLIQVQETGKKVRVVHTHFNQQKQELYVEVIATPIFNEQHQVTQIIESHRDITRHIRKEQKLQQLATIDTLTQIYNRLKFDQELETQISLAIKSQTFFGLIMLDIDHFKHINDEFGHDVGDDILKKFVYVVSKNIRKEDILARWGGEEFMLILPMCNIQTAQSIALNLQKSIAGYNFNIGRPVTSSFGVTCFSNSDSPECITKRVDDALYQSKQNGRNCVTVLE
ncbi:MAG: diguanylate cyclase [Pseudomonadota bacterium]